MEFTYTQAKKIIKELGRFEVYDYDNYGLTIIKIDDGREYTIGTEEEADEAWEEYLDGHIEGCVNTEMSEWASRYFDDEVCKRDARYDGRGHSLSNYDGNELEIADLVAFRIN